MDGTLADVSTMLGALVSRPVYGLSDEALTESLVDVFAVASQATAAAAVLAREAAGRDLPKRSGATSGVAWLRDVLRIAPTEARRLLALGEIVDARPVLAQAVVDGTANTAQVAAIGTVLADVPGDDPGLVDKVEQMLVEHAARFEPTILRRLGERVRAHVNPDLADERLRERLAREEELPGSAAGSRCRPTAWVGCGCAACWMSRVPRS